MHCHALCFVYLDHYTLTTTANARANAVAFCGLANPVAQRKRSGR